jgi:pSer/pThr/pTyr-binding forkhead associated (FHA) protein
MKAKLVVVGGDAKAAEINLNLPVIIGRGRGATLTLPHPLVSRKHCEIFESNGALMVRDLGSLNGTYVGSHRVEEAPLPPGELLTVATVNFRAVYEAANEDNLNPPNDVGNSDSTHGALQSTDKGGPPVGKRNYYSTPPVDEPVDRDTEWQMGNAPPRNSSHDDDDLSSLLNDSK